MSKSYDAEKETFMGVPRKKIPWWPKIDYNKCNFCMECDKFCPHDVYAKNNDEKHQLIVKNPYNCVVFCSGCDEICPVSAISHQSRKETLGIIRSLRKK